MSNIYGEVIDTEDIVGRPSISLEEVIRDSAKRIVNGHVDRMGRTHHYKRGLSSELANLIPIVRTLLIVELNKLLGEQEKRSDI